jgi:hypothetical protein
VQVSGLQCPVRVAVGTIRCRVVSDRSVEVSVEVESLPYGPAATAMVDPPLGVASARALGVERMPEQLDAGAGGDNELAGGAGDIDRRADCGQRSGPAEPAFRLERGRCAAPER